MAVGFPAKTNFATGEVLTATNMNDITGTLNLLQSTLYPAGRNKIINGDFGVWQRGTSITYSVAGSFTYTADRFNIWHNGSTAGTITATQQTFTAGTAPVSGYEGTFFHRATITTLGTGQTVLDLNQRIEDVRTFAGNTVSLSFWLKSSGTYTPAVFLQQNFGSGGSATVDIAMTLTGGSATTAWQRYTATVAVPSISGKTIGTSSFLNVLIRTGSPTNGQTIDIWGVQLENGSTASPFQTASGSIGGELALCQRYYMRCNSVTAYGYISNLTTAVSTTRALGQLPLKVTMRTTPTLIDYSTIQLTPDDSNVTAVTSITIATGATNDASMMNFNVASGLTQFRPYFAAGNNSTSAYIGLSAEI
jgi:hypothetical protein